MDVSLDDYISKSNFKVQIGNPSYNKANQHVKPIPPGGLQTGKKKFGPGFHGNKVADYSITVPAVRKSATNVNKTNPVRDARERLQIKKPLDARDKLNKKQPVDARQKLINIRGQSSGKDSVEQLRPFDARDKLQAKKQPGQPKVEAQTGGFSLTRTVANNAGAAMAGAPAQGHIIRTLTKVMPPGYENIGTALPLQIAPKQVKQAPPPVQPSVKRRLGPQPGTNQPIENLTRTVSNARPPQYRPQQHQFHPDPPLAPPIDHYSQPTAPQPQSYHPSAHTIHVQQGPSPTQYAPSQSHAPPHHHQAPPSGHYAPPSQQPLYQTPPQDYRTYQYSTPAPSSPTLVHIHPPSYQHPNPPYPVDSSDFVQQIQESGVPNPHSVAMPRIQVHNDQYRPSAPPQPVYQSHVTPNYPPAHPHYSYASPEPLEHHTVYQSPPQETSFTRPIPKSAATSSGMFVKTIVNEAPRVYEAPRVHDTPRIQTTSHPSLKRRSTESMGPLRMSSTSTIPVIRSVDNDTAQGREYGYTKSVIPLQEPVVKKAREQEDDSMVISPLQGYRIVISSLNNSVTQEDIIELFGAIGAVRRVKMVKAGVAEVVYVKKEDAINAVKTYHERELDGMPMTVKMATPSSARVKEVAEKLPPSVRPAASAPLKLKKTDGSLRDADKKGVDVGVLHRALFKTGTTPSTKPVTFTVNI